MSILNEITRIGNAADKIAAKAVAMGLKDDSGVKLTSSSKIDVVAGAVEDIDIFTAQLDARVMSENGQKDADGNITHWCPKTAADTGIKRFLAKNPAGYHLSSSVSVPIVDIEVTPSGEEQTIYAFESGGLIASVVVAAAETDLIDGKTYAEVEALLAAI